MFWLNFSTIKFQVGGLIFEESEKKLGVVEKKGDIFTIYLYRVGRKNGQRWKSFFLFDFSAILIDSKFYEKTQTEGDFAYH